MKYTLLLVLLAAPFITQAQWKDMVKKATPLTRSIPNISSIPNLGKTQSPIDIGEGLKEALNKGVTEQVSKLAATDGFYKNEAVKILMPGELQKVDQTMRKMGMSKQADEAIQLLNRAAEDAVKEATPIFITAIKDISIADAKGILQGNENAATNYLQSKTTALLYNQFIPVVQKSFAKVGADVIWSAVITKYNNLPFVSKVNPDLTDYVTNKALEGVFKMIAVEEKNIRTNLNSRTSDLLKKVFALQDKK